MTIRSVNIINGIPYIVIGWAPVIYYFFGSTTATFDSLEKSIIAIVLINIFVAFNLMGWWALKGKLKNKDDPTLTNSEKTRSNFYTTILVLPTIIAFAFIIFTKSDSIIFKTAFALVTVFCFYMIAKHIITKKGS